MKRKLASVQRIKALSPIRGADKIESATILGWNVVVQKDLYKVGDKCIFCEIDALLPEEEWAEFMRPRGFRVKSCKLRGALSQGLALPMDILPLGPYEYAIGEDVSKTLGITKYEPPPRFGFNSGQAAGPFPSFVPKTDELRLQSVLPVLEELKGLPLYWTVKCDGTSSTFAKLDGEFYACSRNLRKKSGDNVYWSMVEKYKLEEYIPDGFAIQGEICGPGIQKNRLKLKEPDLFVFDVFDIKAGRYVGFDKFMSFCSRLKTVPVEEVIPSAENARGAELTTDNIDLSLDAWLERAKGLYEGTDNRREGIVVRPLTPTFSREVGGRLSFKVLNNDFLLKDEK